MGDLEHELRREIDTLRAQLDDARRAKEASPFDTDNPNGFFRLSLDMLCIAGTDGYFRTLNGVWTPTLGWSVEELKSRPWLDFVHPDDVEATVRAGEQLAFGKSLIQFENRYRCKDGTFRFLQWAAAVTSEGVIYACARDVTAERDGAARDRLLFMASPLPMWLVEADTMRFVDANDAAVLAYGYSLEELLSMSLNQIVSEEQHESLQRIMKEAVDTGRVVATDRRHRTRTGHHRHVEVTGHRLPTDGPAMVLWIVVDVTESDRLDEERAHHVERLRLLELSVSELNDAVMITKAAPLSEPGPQIEYVNQAVERMSGYSSAEMIGKSPRMLQGPKTDRTALARMRGAFERKEPIREEIINYTKSGVPYWVELHIAPVHDDTGQATHFVSIQRDTTQQRASADALRRSEMQLRQAQKMDAIGTLAGGVAHDFNNLLSVILSYTTLAMGELKETDPLRSDLEEIHSAGMRASELTKQLLAFSRHQIEQPGASDVSGVVRDVERMLGRLLGEDIEITIHAPESAGRVLVDSSQLEQVIMNLAVNARDAMPYGGNLMIETSSVVLDEEYASSHRGVAPGPYVLLAVTDTGIGMDPEVLDRVFEPFFTTKGQGEGTGLGLSTVFGIVRKCGGHTSVYSELGVGTTFRIYLPRTERPEGEAVSAPPPSGSLRGSETILLVEDDNAVRNVIRSILVKNGYRVLEAQNGGEAYLISEQLSAKIDLLLSDVIMPRMSGPHLAGRISSARPEMKVLFISGYTEKAIDHHGVFDSGVEFLAKPILPNALLKKVRQVLDAPKGETL